MTCDMESLAKKRKLISPSETASLLKYLTNVSTNATSESDSPSYQSSKNSDTTIVDVDENNNNSSDHKSMKSNSNKSKTKAVPVLQDRLTSYGNWLSFDSEKNIMFGSLCKEHSFKNTMAMGTNNFKTTTIDLHIVSNDHKAALPFPKAKQDLNIAIANAETDTSMILQNGLVQNLIRIQILSLILTEREKKSHTILKYLTDFALLGFFISQILGQNNPCSSM